MRKILLCWLMLLAMTVPALAEDGPTVKYRIEYEDDWIGDPVTVYDLKQTKLYPEYLIGAWNAIPFWAAGYCDCHNFYSDGSYRFVYNQMMPLDPRVSQDGTWEIVDNKVIVTIQSLTLHEGVDKVTYSSAFGYKLRGGTDREVLLDPPMQIEYDLYDLHYATWDDVREHGIFVGEYSRLLTASFAGQRFYKLDETGIEKYIAPITPTLLCGVWRVFDSYDEVYTDKTHTFYPDGRYEFAIGEDVERGAWHIEDGVVLIEIGEPLEKYPMEVSYLHYNDEPDRDGVRRPDQLRAEFDHEVHKETSFPMD